MEKGKDKKVGERGMGKRLGKGVRVKGWGKG
jgi:hypothetical protein